MTKKETIKIWRDRGYITEREAAERVGRKSGGNIKKLMARYSVPRVRLCGANYYLDGEHLKDVPVLKPNRHVASQTTERAVDKFIDKAVEKTQELPLGWMDGKAEEKKTTDNRVRVNFSRDDFAVSHFHPFPFFKGEVISYEGNRLTITEVAQNADGSVTIAGVAMYGEPSNPPPVTPEKTDAEKLDGVRFNGWNLKNQGNSVELRAINMLCATFSSENLIGLARQIVRRIDGDQPDYRALYEAELNRRMKIETQVMELAEQVRGQQ